MFQTSVLLSGVLLLWFGPLGLEALWQNRVVLFKTLLPFVLMGLLSYVHLTLQPKIETRLAQVKPDEPAPEGFAGQLKPYRMLCKRLATFCLFLVITTIIFGVQVYGSFSATLTAALVSLAALFSWRANKTLVRFGWV